MKELANVPLKALNKGFDSRVVKYEDIHNISNKDFSKLVNAIDPQNGEVILDLGCGYGSVTRETLSRNDDKDLFFCLSDSSQVQLNRAIFEMNNVSNKSLLPNNMCFYLDDIVYTNFCENYFDKVVAKMVIHEIKKESQETACKQIFRILKPGGKLIIWDLALNESNQNFIQNIISKKDELADFTDLVDNRYLFTKKELFEILHESGFICIEEKFEINYRLETKKRLRAEFNNDYNKLLSWNNFIIKMTKECSSNTHKPVIRNGLERDNLILNIPKAIFIAYKPFEQAI